MRMLLRTLGLKRPKFSELLPLNHEPSVPPTARPRSFAALSLSGSGRVGGRQGGEVGGGCGGAQLTTGRKIARRRRLKQIKSQKVKTCHLSTFRLFVLLVTFQLFDFSVLCDFSGLFGTFRDFLTFQDFRVSGLFVVLVTFRRF